MPGSFSPTQFEANERANSQPVHCYTFARGSKLWCYTDQQEDVTVSGVTYRAAAIRHSEYAKDDETAAGEVSITMSDQTPIVADLHGKLAGALPVTVTIRQTHRSGVNVTTPSLVVRFSGWVKDRTIAKGECTFTTSSIAALLERPLLRMTCSPTCNYTVYGPGCGVDPAPFTTTGCAITSITGRTLVVASASAKPAGYYTAGYLVVSNGPAIGERCFIQTHTGASLELLHDPPVGMTALDTIAITAGCDGVEATCRTKFSNIKFFGGFPRVPQVNPFEKAEG